MKVGILTFHRAKNYGAMLQCYALVSYLRSMKYDVSVLDYRPSYLAGAKDVGFMWSIRKILRFVAYWILSKGEAKYVDSFGVFTKKYIPVQSMDGVETLEALICGSDQIWSTKICGKLDPVFFGKLESGLPMRKISYAASNGNVLLNKKQICEFRKLLEGMDAVSVREKTLQDFLKCIGISSQLVLDPVLLAGDKLFEPILCPIRQKKPYVLIYELTHLEATYLLAQKIAKSLDADILVMAGGMKAYFKKGIINKQGLTPAQFVSYFKQAACVITTSFHGTAFSIVYERPFYSMYMNSEKDDRILSLLEELNLLERSVRHLNDISYSSINYDLVRPRLENLRKRSSEFLQNALS